MRSVARIIIAGSSEQSRTQLSRLLTSSGFPIFRCCASVGELRRALNETEDGLLILAGQLPDSSTDELFWDYGDRMQILLIARQPVLDACEASEIFRLAMPVSVQAVIGSVEMLTQLHRMRLPKRGEKEREMVERAKKVLMRSEHLSEEEAHRRIQRYAMDHGMKMSDYADRILKKAGESG